MKSNISFTSEWGAKSVDEEERFHLAGGQSVFQELSGTKFITVLPI